MKDNLEQTHITRRYGDDDCDVIFHASTPPSDDPVVYPPLNPYVTTRDDIVIEHDMAMTLSDGTTIYTDIYRPDTDRQVPVLLSWSFAGKNYNFYTRTGGVGHWGVQDAVSPMAKQEGPDPAYWCYHGYAVANPDPRGINNSEGNANLLGAYDVADCCEFIDWLGEQPWSNGRVAMTGTAWQGNNAWFVAAARPKHLAAVAPTIAFSDLYRMLLMRGGVMDDGIMTHILSRMHGHGCYEDVVAMGHEYPLMNSYWEDKRAHVEDIDIPTYAVGIYNMFHADCFDAFRRVGTDKKWLRVATTSNWFDNYDPVHLEDLRMFFDRYLKNIHNGWEFTPQVRVSLYDAAGNIIDRPETEWPPQRAGHVRHWLDAATATLTTEPSAVESEASYQADGNGSTSFTTTFVERTELLGYGKLRLWVEARDADDLDLFVRIEHLDADGNLVAIPEFIDPHQGLSGILRVSQRELDPDRSTAAEPFLTHRVEHKLAPGQIVPVDIPLWPFGFVWHAGDQLRLTVKDTPVRTTPGNRGVDVITREHWEVHNTGTHIIHTGGRYDSYLLLPEIRS